MDTLNRLMTDGETYIWFRKNERPEHPHDKLGLFQFEPMTLEKFKVEREVLWERYTGAGKMKKFEEVSFASQNFGVRPSCRLHYFSLAPH